MKCKLFRIELAAAGAEEALDAFLGTVDVDHVAAHLVAGEAPFWSVLVFYEERPVREHAYREIVLTPEQKRVYEVLRAWRSGRAAVEGTMPGMIVQNRMLMELVRARAATADELAGMGGLDAEWVAEYGEEVLEILARFFGETGQ